MFGRDNLTINVMEDILMNYSHHKLNEMLKNEQVRVLMRYFISNGKEKFLHNLGFSQINSRDTQDNIQE